jgi:hypothetical protein
MIVGLAMVKIGNGDSGKPARRNQRLFLGGHPAGLSGRVSRRQFLPPAILILEAEDKLVGPGVVELAADYLLDVFPVRAQPFQDFFLLAQAGLGFGQPLLALRLELAEPVVLRPRLPEEDARRQAEAEKQHKIKADDDATHGDVKDRRRSTAPERRE